MFKISFFDIDPLMSDNGEFKEYEGTTSDIIVDVALNFIGKSVEKEKPFFAVIWDGSPHRPFRALEKDKEGFEKSIMQCHFEYSPGFIGHNGTMTINFQNSNHKSQTRLTASLDGEVGQGRAGKFQFSNTSNSKILYSSYFENCFF